MAGYGVGGAAASGIESGFNLGLRATQLDEQRKQREFENARQTAADTRQTALDARTAARQDKLDTNSEDDRALAGVNSEMEDNRLAMAGLSQQYGGLAKVPQSEAAPHIAKAQGIYAQRQQILQRRLAPVLQKEQQWAQDISSKVAAQQLDPDTLSPADLRRWITASTGKPVQYFLSAGGAPSQARQDIDNFEAGVQTGNSNLTTQGANGLFSRDIQKNLGAIASDGSQIIDKRLDQLVPAYGNPAGATPGVSAANPMQGLTAALTAATSPVSAGNVPPMGEAGLPKPAVTGGTPQALTPGTDPNRVIPILKVTARHADGTEVTYHAPVTLNQSTDPNDTVHPGVSVSDAMERIGKTGALEAWINTPGARAKIEQALKDDPGPTTFEQAYAAMHGDPKALLQVGQGDPTSVKIQAIQNLAKTQGITFTEASAQLAGRGAGGPVAQKLADIDASDLSDADKTAAKRAATLGVKAAGTGVGARVSSPAQAARDNDAVKILQQEKTAIEARLAKGDPRAQADLDSINKEIAGKTKDKGTAGHLSDDAVDSMAEQYLNGDTSVFTNLGRGAQGAENVVRIREAVARIAKDRGMSPAQIAMVGARMQGDKAAFRTAGTKGANIEMAVVEAGQLADLALKASDAVPRTSFTPVNKAILAFQSNTGDPAVAQFGAANLAFINTYARAISPTGVPTVHDKQHAEEVLSRAQSPEQYKATVNQMKMEMNAAQASPGAVRERLSQRVGGTGLGGAGTAAPANVQTATNPKTGEKLMLQGGQWVPFK